MRRIRTSEIRMKFMQIHASKLALDQHRTNRWQLSRPDDQNEIGPTSFVNVRAMYMYVPYLRRSHQNYQAARL